MSDYVGSLITAGTIETGRVFTSAYPLTYAVVVETMTKRASRIGADVANIALLICPAILSAKVAADASDPISADVISAGIGVAINRSKVAHYRDASAVVGVPTTDDVIGALSDAAWTVMRSDLVDALSVWTRRDSLDAILDTVDGFTRSTLVDAAREATADDDRRTPLSALAVRAAGLKRTDRAAVRVREMIGNALTEAQSYAAPTRAYATVNRPHTDVWSDDARALAADGIGRPGGKGKANTWTRGNRDNSGPASLVYVEHADGTAGVFDPRNGGTYELASSDALIKARTLRAVVVKAYERDADNRAADLFANACEPMGAVAKANTRKTKRSGGVGGPVTVGRANPVRV